MKGSSHIHPIRKLLVANRGEIALRIMRTAREMGIATVAVYSEADSNAPFARYADEAVCIGPAPSSESYLRIDGILEAAQTTGADAIHPGYGFLSENARFSRAVRERGIVFVGPMEHAMETMGDKLAAKAAVEPFEVPMVPGTPGSITSVKAALEAAEHIGFPLLIKASAGGGGKGMRVVERMEDLGDHFTRAVSEAENAFGDGSVFLERFVTRPRHIEIQILADTHGHVVHLFERECSIQRRHQKVIEEAPSSILSDELREKMGACAIEVAKSCDYVGAGTVEFLLDEHHHFYFLEMNTRLQVEHPVTECITGLDIVREQIRIAEGHPLSIQQSDIAINGHAIEIRIYAENARNGFLPNTGILKRYRPPTGPGVRVDDGVEEGQEVSIHYDPMLAKLVVHATHREAAIEKALIAIDTYEISGVETTLEFGRFAINHAAFRSGKFDTHFVANHFSGTAMDRPIPVDDSTIAALASGLVARHTRTVDSSGDTKQTSRPTSRWRHRRMEG